MEFLDQYDDLKKTASIDKEKLRDKDFALIIQGEKSEHKKFATVDPEVTKTSTEYFINNLDKMPDEYINVAGPNLKEACFKYDIDIPQELEDFDFGSKKRKVKQAKEKIKEEDFGIVINGDGKFPLRNKEEIIKAIEQYDNVKDRLTKEQKKELAAKIDSAAEKFGIERKTKLKPNPEIERDMEFRVKRLPKRDKEAYMKLAHMVKEGELNVEKGIKVMKKLDDENNMKQRCASPETVLAKMEGAEDANMFEKAASITDELEYAMQDKDTKEKVKKELKSQFDDSLVDSLCQDPKTIFDSLPDPHKDLIERIVKSNI